jgi:hypothetical protein
MAEQLIPGAGMLSNPAVGQELLVTGAGVLSEGIGALYWIIQAATVDDPTDAQVVLGLDGSGTAVPAGLRGTLPCPESSQTVIAPDLASVMLASTGYELFWVWSNA